MIQLLDLADEAQWKTGKLVGAHGMTDVHDIPFGGDVDDDRGFARIDEVAFEDGSRGEVLRTHPKWVDHGTIKGWFPRRELPEDAVFAANFGFVEGAKHTDGAEFQVWAHFDNEDGDHVWTRIARQSKGYSGAARTFRADLSHLAGKEVGIELRVDADGTSTQDWAAWRNPRIISESVHRTMPVTVSLDRFTVRNADEDSWYNRGGDEPYLFVMGFYVDNRTVDVQEPSAKAWPFSVPDTHGNLGRSGVVEGDSFKIPDRTGKFEKELHVIGTSLSGAPSIPRFLGKKLTRLGLIVVALEHDSTDTSTSEKGRRTFVREAHDEINSVLQEKINALEDGSGSLSVSNSDIKEVKKAIGKAVKNKISDETLESLDLFGVANPDDEVGSAFEMWSYQEIQDAEEKGIPFTMDFQNKDAGVRYQVDGSVRTL